jgi:hypothetical protein
VFSKFRACCCVCMLHSSGRSFIADTSIVILELIAPHDVAHCHMFVGCITLKLTISKQILNWNCRAVQLLYLFLCLGQILSEYGDETCAQTLTTANYEIIQNMVICLVVSARFLM